MKPTTIEQELFWIKESANLEYPKFITLVERGEVVAIRVYSNYHIIELPIDRVKALKIKHDRFEHFDVINGKTSLEIEGVNFTMVDDCGLINLNYKPTVVRNLAPIRQELVAQYLKYADKGGYTEKREEVQHYQSHLPRIKVKVKKVEKWISTKEFKVNLQLHNDYYTTNGYLHLMLSYIIINRIINEDNIVKTSYVNTCESKSGLVYHKVNAEFINGITGDLTKVLKTTENFANAIIEYCEGE